MGKTGIEEEVERLCKCAKVHSGWADEDEVDKTRNLFTSPHKDQDCGLWRSAGKPSNSSFGEEYEFRFASC